MATLQLLTKKIKTLYGSKFFKIVLFFIVLIFTFILRAHNYEKTPTPSHMDEQLYALSGINLIEIGVPVSWSTLDYPESAIFFEGTISHKGGEPSASVKLYKPWLDEPPLFSLFVGAFAHLFGADRNGFIPSSYIRFPIVLISTLTSILVFLIAKKVSGYSIGILSMFIYGTEPIMVFASRSAMPETLITLLYLLVAYLLICFFRSPKFRYLIPIPILAGLAGLSKPTGYFILGIAIYLMIVKLAEIEFNWKKIFLFSGYLILGTIPFVLFYIWYGNYFDSEIFKRIISIQGFRPVGFGNLAWFFMTPSFSTVIFKSSWYVYLLLASAFYVFQPKEKYEKVISLSFVYWLCVVIVSSGEVDLLSWYRFPALPFMAIMGAWGIVYLVKKADFFASFLAVGLFLGPRTLLVNAFRPNVTQEAFRVSMLTLLAPSLLDSVFRKKVFKVLSRAVIIGVIVIGMWWNIKYVYNAYEIECENKICPMVPVTPLSAIHFPLVWRLFVLSE